MALVQVSGWSLGSPGACHHEAQCLIGNGVGEKVGAGLLGGVLALLVVLVVTAYRRRNSIYQKIV